MAVIGAILAVGAGIWLAVLIAGWIASGGPEFTETRSLVFAAAGFVFGLQLVSASMFLTVFRSEPASAMAP